MASAYTQSNSNQTKTFLLITVFALLTVGFFYALGSYTRNPIFVIIGLVIGIGQPLIGYFFGDKMALSFAKAEEVTYDQQPQLHEMVTNLARVARIKTPKIYISPDQSANAFATGRDPSHASICFNQGILDLLDKNELEGVAAHELSHVKNYDTLIMTLAAILASVIGAVADIAGRMMLWGGGRSSDDNKNPFAIVLYIAAIFLTPFIAFMLQLAISRSREFLADASAVTITRYPQGLRNALLKLDSSPVPSDTAHSFTNHMYIAEPKKNLGQNVKGWFSTHPSVEERVKRLDEMG
jgi:heat shock protein HtpX